MSEKMEAVATSEAPAALGAYSQAVKANGFVFVSGQLGIDPARCPGNIERTGNTSAASVPLLLDELVGGGAITSGQKALCVGFGGGLTWAGALLELA